MSPALIPPTYGNTQAWVDSSAHVVDSTSETFSNQLLGDDYSHLIYGKGEKIPTGEEGEFVELLRSLHVVVEKTPQGEYFAYWASPNIDLKERYFGYGEERDEAINNLLIDIANDVAVLESDAEEVLHPSAVAVRNALRQFFAYHKNA